MTRARVNRPGLQQLVTAKAASEETGVPYTSLRDMAFRGQVKVVRLGRAWYFDRRELAAAIEASKSNLAEAR